MSSRIALSFTLILFVLIVSVHPVQALDKVESTPESQLETVELFNLLPNQDAWWSLKLSKNMSQIAGEPSLGYFTFSRLAPYTLGWPDADSNLVDFKYGNFQDEDIEEIAELIRGIEVVSVIMSTGIMQMEFENNCDIGNLTHGVSAQSATSASNFDPTSIVLLIANEYDYEGFTYLCGVVSDGYGMYPVLVIPNTFTELRDIIDENAIGDWIPQSEDDNSA